MQWANPHISKVYEALTAVVDGRVQLLAQDMAHVFSSSRKKYYIVTYQKETNSITSNDNSAYYMKKLSYPMIAYLLVTKHIKYDQNIAGFLGGILWKDVNQKYNNKYDQALAEVLKRLEEEGAPVVAIQEHTQQIYDAACGLCLKQYGRATRPPSAY